MTMDLQRDHERRAHEQCGPVNPARRAEPLAMCSRLLARTTTPTSVTHPLTCARPHVEPARPSNPRIRTMPQPHNPDLPTYRGRHAPGLAVRRRPGRRRRARERGRRRPRCRWRRRPWWGRRRRGRRRVCDGEKGGRQRREIDQVTTVGALHRAGHAHHRLLPDGSKGLQRVDVHSLRELPARRPARAACLGLHPCRATAARSGSVASASTRNRTGTSTSTVVGGSSTSTPVVLGAQGHVLVLVAGGTTNIDARRGRGECEGRVALEAGEGACGDACRRRRPDPDPEARGHKAKPVHMSNCTAMPRNHMICAVRQT